MARDPFEQHSILKLRDDNCREVEDWVVVEEPLEIRVSGEPLAVIMRTPGHDIELVAGFALTEGVVRSAEQIGFINHCRTESDGNLNTVEIGLTADARFDPERLRRTFMASAACGLCGKASLEALSTQATPVKSDLRVQRRVLESLPDRLSRSQETFGRTGALHAAALFDAQGSLLICREDVGRHNAVDKVIGRSLLDHLSLGDKVLLVSGRTSFEILQKAAVAGLPMVCAISGPTSLAIETARAFTITLVNFLRGRGMNIASCAERIVDL